MPPAWTLRVPWPHWDVLTPGGKVSAARRAGHQVPWLSINRIGHHLHHRQYQEAVYAWREAARCAAVEDGIPPVPQDQPWVLLLSLWTATNHPLDPTGVVEGAKPLVDGLVLAGILAGDSEDFVLGALGRSRKAPTRGEAGVDISLAPCPPDWRW